MLNFRAMLGPKSLVTWSDESGHKVHFMKIELSPYPNTTITADYFDTRFMQIGQYLADI